jgi:hypothetical protein
MNRRMKSICLALLGSALLGGAVHAAPAPRVFSLDPQQLVLTRARLATNDAALLPALGRLRREADKALKAVPGSVMDKAKTPPSGDKHDYFSLAPYSWPDPAKPDGLPWINRDGQVNPESRRDNDHDALSRLCSQVETLALAYYLTGHEPYAAKAAALLQAWFLDPATKMNPNLEFAQGVPGRSTGRGTGIIDTVQVIKLTDAIGLLAGAKAWTPDAQRGLEDWFRAYLHWLLTSRHGHDEAKATNNHGSWYLAQTAAFALFTGDTAQARKQVELGRARIASQIEPDGRQPLELKRTKSYSYTLFNLEALFTLAEIGRRLDVDLFHYRTADGRSLRAAFDYVAPYLDPAQKWPDQQIQAIHQPDAALAALLRRAATLYPDGNYAALLPRAAAELAPSRFQLLWP